ncbi:MAG: hypothetical protein ACK574_06995 [Bacteroidota bacterium]
MKKLLKSVLFILGSTTCVIAANQDKPNQNTKAAIVAVAGEIQGYWGMCGDVVACLEHPVLAHLQCPVLAHLQCVSISKDNADPVLAHKQHVSIHNIEVYLVTPLYVPFCSKILSGTRKHRIKHTNRTSA